MLSEVLEKLDVERPHTDRHAEMSAVELLTLKALMRAVVARVVDYTKAGRRRPRVFRFVGGEVNLEYTEAGEMRLRSSTTGRLLASTFPGKVW